MPDTGSPRADAQADFDRARRRAAFARTLSRLRRQREDAGAILDFDDVVAALGRAGSRYVGRELIALDTIVGTVNRSADFDRGFRPTTNRVRDRWQRIAEAVRRGETLPPIDALRVGELHFVRDGHHRVSVARALGLETIDAVVTEVTTRLAPPPDMRPSMLPLKSHERMFRERVPLPAGRAVEIRLDDEWRYAALAEGVEAWGFRHIEQSGEPLSREQVARAWYELDFRPIVELLRESRLAAPGQETEAYMRFVTLRYLLLRTHDWDDGTIERVFDALDAPGAAVDDTLVHKLRRELGR